MKQRSTGLLLLCFLGLSACRGGGGNPSPSSDLRFYDAHAHIMGSWEAGTIGDLVKDHELKHIVLLGTSGAIEEQTADADHVSGYTFFADMASLDTGQIRTQLQQGARGIGEVSIRHFASGPAAEADEHDFDDVRFLAVYDLAREFTVPVNFHFDYHADHVAEISRTLPNYGAVNFVWAHAGDAQPDQLEPLLRDHGNLYLDLSCRNNLDAFDGRLENMDDQRLDQGGQLKTEWKNLFEAFPDRILYGSDIGPSGRLEVYGAIENYYRDVLAGLDSELAEKIAYKNAEALFR